jgi:hypothetical protein
VKNLDEPPRGPAPAGAIVAGRGRKLAEVDNPLGDVSALRVSSGSAASAASCASIASRSALRWSLRNSRFWPPG